MNTNGELPENFEWSSSTESVVETIVFDDINQDSLVDTFLVINNESGRYFDILESNLYSITDVKINQISLPDTLYYWQQKPANLYFKYDVSINDIITINYKKMTKPDMIVSNWGVFNNYIFYYQDEISLIDDTVPFVKDTFCINTYPNPLNITLNDLTVNSNKKLHNPQLELYNIKGQLISRFDNFNLKNNQTNITLQSDLFKNLNPASGIYILKLKDLDCYVTAKILLIK